MNRVQCRKHGVPHVENIHSSKMVFGSEQETFTRSLTVLTSHGNSEGKCAQLK
jgi:hypothetical protein